MKAVDQSNGVDMTFMQASPRNGQEFEAIQATLGIGRTFPSMSGLDHDPDWKDPVNRGVSMKGGLSLSSIRTPS